MEYVAEKRLPPLWKLVRDKTLKDTYLKNSGKLCKVDAETAELIGN